MISCERAWKKILARAKPLGAVRLALDDAAGLVLAESVRAPMAVPPFDNSAMDGFAVKATDIARASARRPVRLRVVTVIAAGKHWRGTLRRGQAAQIMTGAALPRGTDTVVRQEDTRADGGSVEILTAAPRGEAVRRRGSDLVKGRVALPRGTRIGPAALTLIASLGLTRTTVWRRPRVAFLVSGSELRAPGQRLRAGEIFESSHWAVCETLRQLGAEVTWLGTARDDRAETRRLLRRGLRHDVLITAGGVSVGRFDFIRDALREVGAREVLWRVAQRPGKPLLVATRGTTLIFGLPGNPVSSLVSTEMYVKPALRKMMGFPRDAFFPPLMTFPAAAPMTKPAGLRTFHRVSFVKRGGRIAVALTHPDQHSGVFSSMLHAHALTSLPPAMSAVRRGDEIECFVLDPETLARMQSRNP